MSSLGVGVSLSPVPIIGVVLMPAGPRALLVVAAAAAICPVIAAKLIGGRISGLSA